MPGEQEQCELVKKCDLKPQTSLLELAPMLHVYILCVYVCVCVFICVLGHDIKIHFMCQVIVKISLEAPALCYPALLILCVFLNCDKDETIDAEKEESCLFALQREEDFALMVKGIPSKLDVGKSHGPCCMLE